MGINQCKLISLPNISDDRGNLGILESTRHIPFEIKRIFYIYNVPSQHTRGAHAHKKLQQFIIGFGDGFEVELDDGKEKKIFKLDNAVSGLYVAPMTWTNVDKFSPNSICLVLASEPYEEEDYLRDYDDFCQAVNRLN